MRLAPGPNALAFPGFAQPHSVLVVTPKSLSKTAPSQESGLEHHSQGGILSPPRRTGRRIPSWFGRAAKVTKMPGAS